MDEELRESLLETLNEIWEFLDNYADVVDGDNGEPKPNKAMNLLRKVDDLTAILMNQ